MKTSARILPVLAKILILDLQLTVAKPPIEPNVPWGFLREQKADKLLIILKKRGVK